MAKRHETPTETPVETTPAETKPLTIQGLTFHAPIRYSAGHVLTDVEAKVLNQTLAENLRNNFADTVKAAIEKAGDKALVDMAELRAEFATYAAEYTFAAGPGRGPRPAADPVGAEAFRLAKADVEAAIRAKGHKVGKGGIPMEQVNDLATRHLAANAGAYTAKAEAIVAAKSAAVETVTLDDLGLAA